MKKNNLLLAFLVLAGVIIGISILGWIMLKPEMLQLQGEAEATEVRVSGKVPGRIERLLVAEGAQVKKGDTLVIIESPELAAKLLQAVAAEDAASAQNRKALKGARKEQIAAAYDLWQKAVAGAELAKKTFDRIQKLYEEGVVPAQKRDEAEANYKAATSTVGAARSQYEMALNGAELEDKMAALAMVNRAKGAVSEVEVYISETRLIAPISGEVSDIFPKAGELVGSGAPILNIVDLTDMWLTFNIREDLMSSVKMGSEFTAVIPALGNQTVKLKVNYIKAMASYATYKATKMMGSFDAKTFEVRAVPVNPVQGLRPGMSALVDWE